MDPGSSSRSSSYALADKHPAVTDGPASIPPESPADFVESADLKPKRKAKPSVIPSRDQGKSLLPATRVQRILKADKELPAVAKDAVFLISLATEEFIKRLSEACHNIAVREKRVTVQQKDIASVVRRSDEFLFLEEIIPWPDSSDVPQRRKPGQKKNEDTLGAGPTMLDSYLAPSEVPNNASDENIIMNEDGTLQAIGHSGDVIDADELER